MTPGATYRLQLRSEFPFAAAAALAPYLARLGVTHVYCSPVLQAAPGSTHGYDVADPSRVDEGLGGEPGLRALALALRERGLGLVVDIVPNHMAAVAENPWWWDVLQDGPASPFARCFDVGWRRTEYERDPTRVLVPILADQVGRVVDAGGIRLERERDGVRLRYHEHRLPLAPATLGALLAPVAERAGSSELHALARALLALDERPDATRAELRARHERKRALEQRAADLCERVPLAASELDRELARLQADPERLDALLCAQSHRLAYWRAATEELDYRRFFSIDSLVGLRVEDPDVFAATHRLPLGWVADGSVDGLRVDHVDGLRDPTGYLVRLREAAPRAYLVVEKILAGGEELPPDWPVEGTTGYDFLARVEALFLAAEDQEAWSACQERFSGEGRPFEEVVRASKLQVMEEDLRADVSALVRKLAEACARHRRQRDHTRRDLREALQEWLAAFPVYRTYAQPGREPRPAERAHVQAAVRLARERRPDLDGELLEFLGELALLEHEGEAERDFALRLAQVTPAVAAKGIEDTAFYRDQRAPVLAEVGASPASAALEPSAFHAACARAASARPASMLCLSTHDTKRGADVRARLCALHELPLAWESALARLSRACEPHRGGGLPDRGLELCMHLTLVGAWPVDIGRARSFLEKAAREAKLHSSWTAPDEAYERAVRALVEGALGDRAYVDELETFLREQRLVERGRLVSLAQTTLLLTCPGVPDLYQGSELWDLSLVDPDNRRPVDFELRARLLAELDARPPRIPLARDELGVHKLWLVQRLLLHRRERPALYRAARHEPLEVRGSCAEHAVAFERGELAVLVPRLVAGLAGGWGDTRVRLPAGGWRDVLGGRELAGGVHPVGELVESFPVAVLARS